MTDTTARAVADAACSTRASAMPAEERRASIIEATIPLLVAHGERVTTRQIAEAAGVAEGTIFRVFPDKEAVLSASLESALDMARFEAALESAIADKIEFEDQLVAATKIIQRRIVGVWKMVTNLGPKLQEQASRPLMESDALVTMFEPHIALIRVSAPEAARRLRALTLSMTHPMLVGTTMPATEIVDFFLRGIETSK